MVHAASRHVASVNPGAGAWLLEGQRLEAREDVESLRKSISAYDRGLALLGHVDLSTGIARAILWMNRGNASQRAGGPRGFSEAIRCYDLAIVDFERAFGFPSAKGSVSPHCESQIEEHAGIDPVMLNALGAAWMNRGVALQQVRGRDNLEAAVSSHERAIEVLSLLPIDGDPAYRRNLGAAFLNLADALVDLPANEGSDRAANAARYSLHLTEARADSEEGFAGLNLKARRALIVALGGAMCQSDGNSGNQETLASEVRDCIEGGLNLARHWRLKSCDRFLHLEARLFRLGCHFLRIHHAQELGRFVREILKDTQGAFHEELKAIGAEAIQAALETMGRAPVQSSDFANSMLQVRVLRELRETQRWLGQSQQAPALSVV
ncbi:MAG: hypothetical protein KBA71_01465 [Opitutaceae bacterium]|nr:hypothetical protein [Opitutaceae bacterium]